MTIPRIAITPGEPAGIGPDITIMAAQRDWDAELVVIADPDLITERAAMLNLPLTLEEFDPNALPVRTKPGQLSILPMQLAQPVTPGRLNVANAPYVIATLKQAVDGCLDHRFQAMTTGPVQKSIINEAGIPFTGHTELLAQATHTDQIVMMLATQNLRVALATTHLPLKDVPAAITAELLKQTLAILHADLVSKFQIPDPTIAVLGLNPHAGENGHLGREEIDIIIPAVESLRATGMNLLGPLPADTAFNPKVLGEADAVFAMYHDQGLPVLKYAGFGQATNITLGLPVIRTSVDHGTALDLAANGQADDGSMVCAITAAQDMAKLV